MNHFGSYYQKGEKMVTSMHLLRNEIYHQLVVTRATKAISRENHRKSFIIILSNGKALKRWDWELI